MSERRVNVLVVGGGPGPEREVAQASAASACAHLDPSRYAARLVEIGADGAWYDDAGAPLVGGARGADGARGIEGAIEAIRACDVVLPLVHGDVGEDGTLAGLLEMLGAAYVGSGVRAGAVGIDKHLTKLLATDVGVPVAAGIVLEVRDASDDPGAWVASVAHLRYPLFVKPCRQGSSYGVTRVARPGELADAVRSAARYGAHVLVEEQLTGREVDIAAFAAPDGTLRLSPPLEILVGDAAFFDTTRKYDGTAQFLVPACVDDRDLALMHRHTRDLYAALGCAGVARFDYFLTADGPALLEVNTLPGFTEESQVPRMFAADGLAYGDLLALLVDDARSAGAGRS